MASVATLITLKPSLPLSFHFISILYLHEKNRLVMCLLETKLQPSFQQSEMFIRALKSLVESRALSCRPSKVGNPSINSLLCVSSCHDH